MCYFNLKLDYFIIVLVFLSFIVKFPVFFFHYWLPKVHVEARTLARIILAGLLLKFGLGGLLRLLSILKFYNFFSFFVLGFLGVLLGLVLSLVQRDRKSLVAFSSVRHISLAFLGLIYLRNFTQGGDLIMGLSHGFLSSLYF
jgi:NADH-quinone oxidoreductase subunit M